MLTVEQVIAKFGVEIDGHLDRQVAIPVINGLQAQGDVMVVPAAMLNPFPGEATTPVPATGVEVVRGENGGNTHLLQADGDVRFDVHDARGSTVDLRLGVLSVADGATAFLIHPEHGATGIGPGTYVVRRQREQADIVRMVAD